MKKTLLMLLAGLFSAPSDGPIPGVPEWCCGYHDCRPANVSILHKKADESAVLVDGRRLDISPGRVYRSRGSESWYCFRIGLKECRDGKVSEDCVRCVVEGGHVVQEIRVIPVSTRPLGRYLLLPRGGCRNCHF